MERSDVLQIYDVWLEAWNRDISVLDSVTSPDCRVNQARTDDKSSYALTGVDALKEIIQSGCAFFDDVRMKLDVGPVIEDSYITARWTFSGTYNGTMPGAKAEKGKQISFSGTDIFRVEDGKIKEYWVSSDGIHLMKQLEMF